MPPAVRVGLLSVVLVGLWPLAFLYAGPPFPKNLPPMGWWIAGLVLLTAVAEFWIFEVRIRHERQSLSLSEFPLVIGLFTLAPPLVVLVRLLGSGLEYSLHRRTAPIKTVFNIAEAGASTALGCAVFHLVGQGATVTEPRGVFAALAAVAVMGVFDELVIDLGISFYDGWQSASSVAYQAMLTVSLYLISAAGGIAATAALTVGNAAWPALILGIGAMFLGFRSYAALRLRHDSLQRLFHLSTDLNDAREVEEVGRSSLNWAVELLGADRGELILVQRSAEEEGPGTSMPSTGEDPVRVLRWTIKDAGEPVLDHPDLDSPYVTTPLASTVRRWSAASVSPESAEGRFLAGYGWREALWAPLAVDDDTFGCILVGESAPRLHRYTDAYVQLLDTLANQTTVAFRHSRVMDRLSYEAKHDRLTGLPNRAAFQAAADGAVVDLAARPFAIGILDLDGFKTLNDSLGHHAGDIVIATVGARMAEITDDRLMIARLGGDEFAMLLTDTDGDEDVLEVGRKLIAALSTDVQVEGKLVHLAGSLGLAQAPRDGATPDALLRCADLAMYAAKRGSGGLVLFGRDIGHPAGDPVALAADLRLALGRGDVKVAVQPLIDLTTRQVHSVEILARWRHPVLGMVEPEVFVAAAERGGLTSELTRVVLHAALSACRSWAESGLEVRVAVNLSARALDDTELPDRIETLLSDHGVPGNLLGIELTESTLLDNPDRVYPVLERLRELGVQVAIDDFGTGYSSMTYVSSLAPDQVKIDKSFVQRLPLQGRDSAIVRSIIDLGQNLGVEVVAEGVSDQATAQAVKDLGCSIAQGFLYAEPMPWQSLPGWVRRWLDSGLPTGSLELENINGQDDTPDDGGSERLRLVR